MRNLIKEPIIHFLFIGGALFLLFNLLNKNKELHKDYIIRFAQSDTERLVKAYQKNWNSAPDSTTLQQLIREEIRSEIFYREALRMNLDHNDEIIRRRLKQKYEFLVKDFADMEQANDEILQAYYKENISSYLQPKSISFSHLYFNPDHHDDALEQATIALKKITNKDAILDPKKWGDAFHLPYYYANIDKVQARQLFGKEFTDKLFKINKLGIKEIIKSGYGFHIVSVSNISGESPMLFKNIKEKILIDWKLEQQDIYNERLYNNLLKKYQIIYDEQ